MSLGSEAAKPLGLNVTVHSCEMGVISQSSSQMKPYSLYSVLLFTILCHLRLRVIIKDIISVIDIRYLADAFIKSDLP